MENQNLFTNQTYSRIKFSITKLMEELTTNQYNDIEFIYSFDTDKFVKYLLEHSDEQFLMYNYNTIDKIEDLANYLTWLEFKRLKEVSSVDSVVRYNYLSKYFVFFIQYMKSIDKQNMIKDSDYILLWNEFIKIVTNDEYESEQSVLNIEVNKWYKIFFNSLTYKFVYKDLSIKYLEEELNLLKYFDEFEPSINVTDSVTLFTFQPTYFNKNINLYKNIRNAELFDIISNKNISPKELVEQVTLLFYRNQIFLNVPELNIAVNIVGKILEEHKGIEEDVVAKFTTTLFHFKSVEESLGNKYQYVGLSKIKSKIDKYLVELLEHGEPVSDSSIIIDTYTDYINCISLDNVTKLYNLLDK